MIHFDAHADTVTEMFGTGTRMARGVGPSQPCRVDREAQPAAAARLNLHSTFTGLAAYSANLLLHPDRERRVRSRDWYQRMIDFTAAAGAQSTGGHVVSIHPADAE